ncbi:SET and MYND domain-containing protein 3 [Thoreauomyces humboldtii]|nr:SET and MYND domain-containing protein 3 [Thoreauomyces humboldtii]
MHDTTITTTIPPPTPLLDVWLSDHGLLLTASPTKHRIVTASRPIPRGSTIFTTVPLATVVVAPDSHCNACFRPPSITTQLVRCTRCKSASYCNATCQRTDWTAGHSTICKAWSSGSPRGDAHRDHEMLIRVSKALKDTSHADDKDGMRRLNVEVFRTLMSHPSPSQSPQPAHHRVLSERYPMDHLHVFRNNNFTVTDPDMFPVAEGTYPCAALLNHSCNPNACAVFDGPVLHMRAMRDIRRGEEVLDAYVDPVVSRRERRDVLWEKYGFRCDCSRCSGTGGHAGYALVDAYLDDDGAVTMTMTGREVDEALDEWMTPFKTDVSFVELLAHLHECIMETSPHTTHDPSTSTDTSSSSSSSSSTALLNFLTTTFAILPPSILLLPTHPTHHLSLLRHFTTPSPSPYPSTRSRIHSRETYTQTAHRLHSLHTSPHRKAVHSLHATAILSAVYEPSHPLLASHLHLTAKVCWNAIPDGDGDVGGRRRLALEVVGELTRVARGSTVLALGDVIGRHAMEDLDGLGRLVEDALRTSD